MRNKLEGQEVSSPYWDKATVIAVRCGKALLMKKDIFDV